MASVKGILFIDANQYLDLYQRVEGKKVLPAIQEQRDHIFVTEQVVHEVRRNKVQVAARFLSARLKNLELGSLALPDHLFSETETTVNPILSEVQDIRAKIEKIQEQWKKLADEVLGQISRSEDEVSKALAGIFCKAVRPKADEWSRARNRKEVGNPPGKKADPLGDQLTWEQFLSFCKDKEKLWIVTRDGDFVTRHEGKLFLNAALYDDLAHLNDTPPEVYCFDSIDDAIRDFAKVTGVKAEKLPTPEQSKEIKKEQGSLPPPGSVEYIYLAAPPTSGAVGGWLDSDNPFAASVATQNAFWRRNEAAMRAAMDSLSGQIFTEMAIPPPESEKTEKESDKKSDKEPHG